MALRGALPATLEFGEPVGFRRRLGNPLPGYVLARLCKTYMTVKKSSGSTAPQKGSSMLVTPRGSGKGSSTESGRSGSGFGGIHPRRSGSFDWISHPTFIE